MEILNKLANSRKSKAIKLLKKYDFDSWLIISSGNDPNLEYLLCTRPYSTTVALLTRDELIVLGSSLEKSIISMPHVDTVMTYYGTKELISKLIDLIGRASLEKVLINNAPLLKSSHAAKILSSHEKLLKSIGMLYGTNFSDSHNFVFELRSTKTNEELLALESAVKYTIEIIEDIFENKVKIGVSEREIAAEFYREFFLRGAPAFDVIVAFGEHSANPHHTVSDKKLRLGEIGYVDVGLKYGFMCSDITRVFFTSNAPKDAKAVYSTVKNAQDGSIAIIKAGVKARDADKRAREIIKENGYDDKLFSHGLGHPIGVEVHDVGPILSFLASPTAVLDENMAVTVEPALYFEGKYGIRIEDDIIVLSNGVKRLARSPEEPYVIS